MRHDRPGHPLRDVILLVDKSDAKNQSDIGWILAVPIGFFLVGTIGVVATVLLIRERRKPRIAGATLD